MKLTSKHGYGPNCYVIKHEHLGELTSWLYQNNVDWWHVSSGPEGIGFQIRDKIEWFNLRWL